MDCKRIVKSLKQDQFTRVENNGKWFEDGSTIYAKEIRQNVFLLFVILKNIEIENIQALIAHFDSFSSIGMKEPEQVMFYLSIKDKEDLHYFEKYMKISDN
ncbi:hypothetical protein [Chryseobacterium sp. JUb7]|uniref:hypothetical protein n=1 Tax=Chryseobacterium sp. JUb7 TaxID=2940599 RepID=UPI0021698126|nr:hypothetical protein [Chryseobacterium sp. JUb7]MCS3529021.1 hypothetical protein [Chryseobacterium sp. JUb7]